MGGCALLSITHPSLALQRKSPLRRRSRSPFPRPPLQFLPPPPSAAVSCGRQATAGGFKGTKRKTTGREPRRRQRPPPLSLYSIPTPLPIHPPTTLTRTRRFTLYLPRSRALTLKIPPSQSVSLHLLAIPPYYPIHLPIPRTHTHTHSLKPRILPCPSFTPTPASTPPPPNIPPPPPTVAAVSPSAIGSHAVKILRPGLFIQRKAEKACV